MHAQIDEKYTKLPCFESIMLLRMRYIAIKIQSIIKNNQLIYLTHHYKAMSTNL